MTDQSQTQIQPKLTDLEIAQTLDYLKRISLEHEVQHILESLTEQNEIIKDYLIAKKARIKFTVQEPRNKVYQSLYISPKFVFTRGDLFEKSVDLNYSTFSTKDKAVINGSSKLLNSGFEFKCTKDTIDFTLTFRSLKTEWFKERLQQFNDTLRSCFQATFSVVCRSDVSSTIAFLSNEEYKYNICDLDFMSRQILIKYYKTIETADLIYKLAIIMFCPSVIEILENFCQSEFVNLI